MEKKLFESAIGKLREIIEGDERFRLNTYLVGGCVRDLLLGETPKDIDLCIDYPEGSFEFIKYLKENYSKEDVSGFTVFERYGTSRFTLHVGEKESVEIECVIPRTETYNKGPRKPDQVKQTGIYEDATRRDFCCNALYKNIETGDILDPTEKGINDLRDKILRTPLDPEQTYIDDPLRMLRAIRFSCTKGFEIEEETRKKIICYPEYEKLSVERIQEEFNKILISKEAEKGIRELIRSGLMYRIIPEFVKYKEFDQHSKYHSLSWLEHTLSVFRIVIKNDPKASLELRLSALLHDISKPTKYQIKENGQYSYYGHDLDSSERAKEILKKLKYSNDTIEKVSFLIRNHMILKQFYSYKTHSYNGSSKITRRIVRKLGENLKEELELIEADNLSHSLEWNLPGQVNSFMDEVERLKEEDNLTTYISPIDGNNIMKWLCISPGKIIKEIKDAIQEIYEENISLGKEELVKEYEKRYSEFLWFARNDENKYWIFKKKPVKKNGIWWSDNEDVPYEISTNKINYQEILKCEIIHVEAKYIPKIYKRYCKILKIRDIEKEIKESVRKLDSIENFERLMVSHENGDTYMKFEFINEDDYEVV